MDADKLIVDKLIVDKLIVDIRNKWIEEQTKEISYEDVVKAVHSVYAVGNNNTTPLVFQVDGPIHCALAHTILCQLNRQLRSQLHSQLHNQLDSQLRSQLYSQLSSQLHGQLSSQLSSQLHGQLSSQLHGQLSSQLYNQLDSQLRSQLSSQLHGQLSSQLYNQLDSQVDSQLRSQLYSQLRSQLRSQLYSQLSSQLYSQLHGQLRSQLYNQVDSQVDSQLHGQLVRQLKKLWCPLWWQSWAAYYYAGLELGVKYDEEKYNIFQNWCKAVPICRASEKMCIVSKWPTAVRWVDNVLHNDSGPSVEFRDGFKLWSIEGVAVNKQIVMEPETQTLEQIDSESNEEVKRVRIDRYGWDRYLKTATKIDSNFNERDQQEEKLYRLQDGAIIFQPIDPSTGRKYALRCPKEIQTCSQAQNWHSFSLDQYAIHRS